ncbi:aminodeoxychorismate synthase component I [Parerythrobacter jejuensis]|uniref:Probable branched-chain-amino-acid aminotransferase n=1 Tax=Parerythrobacter jejuensis TaxID=795812 RepID=A0A845ARM2_9SPHN|nr:aminodeoxychorismate synthase component I [Parerythrobacter jejuensis]MXP31156.1 aminodeoxychorismate synthase component I [Parerythrobacter jejuensis]MXP33916.1 aminodeoxychorismate synthase component I [Parerythrobacter jejuensis]
MGDREAFVLLDDARAQGAADAHLYEAASAIFVAHRPQDVEAALEQAQAAQTDKGGTLAGYIAYEAGLALEPKLQPLAAERTGANGPLVWLGLFAQKRVIAAADVPAWLAETGGGDVALGPLDPQVSQGAYEEAFEALQQAIQGGDIYQANLTLPLAGSYRGDPVALYAALRPAAQAGYGGLVFDGSHWLLSLSPELFVSLKGGHARAKPMKGTRPRGQSEAEDAALAEELAGSEKDKAENLMIVDLMRNDLSRVAEAGSVSVEAPFAVEHYPTVHQMVTTVHARLQDGKGASDLVRALFPCGSITGAPKIRAMELIQQVERDPRGPYCGAIGRIDADGNAAFNVAIRTLCLTPVENDQGDAVLGVGSAIVADSEPRAEWRETILKGGFVRASNADLLAPGFHLIETMRFDPEQGMPLLEAHLERIKASAATLGFAFDRHAARNQIQALCFDLEHPAKLRLTCNRAGATTLEASPLEEASDDPVACAILPLPVDSGDWRLRHKTSDRGFYEAALSVAREAGAAEALLRRDDGFLTEGCISNLFVERDGVLVTPPLALGLLPGVLRAQLLADGKAEEGTITVEDLEHGFFVGNAVRGLRKARLLI